MVFKVGVVVGRINHLVEVSLDSGPRFPLVETVFILYRGRSIWLQYIRKETPYDSVHECKGFERNRVEFKLMMCCTTPGPTEERTLECS